MTGSALSHLTGAGGYAVGATIEVKGHGASPKGRTGGAL